MFNPIFRDCFEQAAIGQKAIDWEAIYGVNTRSDLNTKQAEAMHELKRMLRSTSKVGRPRSTIEMREIVDWRAGARCRHGGSSAAASPTTTLQSRAPSRAAKRTCKPSDWRSRCAR